MDFMQERITTIHDFRIEERSLCLALEDIAMERPMTLLIPMLFEEIFGDHIENILKHINESNFLTKVVIALAADDEQQYKQVKQFFSKLEIPYIIVWCDGPSVQQVITKMVYLFSEDSETIEWKHYDAAGNIVWQMSMKDGNMTMTNEYGNLESFEIT